jgi:hypothetical protein
MKIIIAILCVGLAMWVGPADAQDTKTFRLTVGLHTAVDQNYKNKIDQIFEAASRVLKKCDVVLMQKGDVGTFRSPNSQGEVSGARERDAVHRENFDVKVVKSMSFCRTRQQSALMGIAGCAWDPTPNRTPEVPQHKSIIVAEHKSIFVAEMDIPFAGRILAHEFGHYTGLPHRDDAKALMVTCKAGEAENVQINTTECMCFRAGRAACVLPDSGPPHCDRLP